MTFIETIHNLVFTKLFFCQTNSQAPTQDFWILSTLFNVSFELDWVEVIVIVDLEINRFKP